MSSPLEKFILENREKFDSDAPDTRVWEKINEQINPDKAVKDTPVRSLHFRRWLSVAAAVVFLGLAVILYYSLRQDKTQMPLAGKTQPKVNPSNGLPTPNAATDTNAVIPKTDPTPIENPTDQKPE
jgi:hypothetical protein